MLESNPLVSVLALTSGTATPHKGAEEQAKIAAQRGQKVVGIRG